MMIEKFTVKIEKEDGVFVGLIIYEDGSFDTTQGNHIQELYKRISEVLCLRLEDDTKSEDKEVNK